jgi:hypothetical protein
MSTLTQPEIRTVLLAMNLNEARLINGQVVKCVVIPAGARPDSREFCISGISVFYPQATLGHPRFSTEKTVRFLAGGLLDLDF